MTTNTIHPDLPPADWVSKCGRFVLYRGDCLAVLGAMPDGAVDAVVIDPPYSSGGQFRGDRAQDTRAKYLDSSSSNKDLPNFGGDTRDQRSFHFWASLWASQAMRITKPSGIACFFTDWRQLPISTDYMQSGGWLWRGVVPWAKPTSRPQMGRFNAQCEYVVWGSNGPLPVDRGVECLPGFFNHSAPQDRQHVTEKPVGLLEEIAQISPADAAILDPFAGSGTTGVACVKTGRRFIGVELDPHYFEVARKRIEQAITDYNGGPMFENVEPQTLYEGGA